MGIGYNPSPVNTGVMLNLDAANIKSYPGSGSTWYDISGNKRNGTLVGNTIYNAGNKGSFDFDGSGDYIQLPANSLNFGTSPFSMEAWLRADTLSGIDVIYASQSSNQNGHIACGHYGTGLPYGLGFNMADYNGSVRQITSFGTIAVINTWYHVVFLKNASNQYVVYVNTVPSTTNATSTVSLASADPRIGINPDPLGSGEIWDGKIANFRVYNRALSETEIKKNFNALRGRFNI